MGRVLNGSGENQLLLRNGRAYPATLVGIEDAEGKDFKDPNKTVLKWKLTWEIHGKRNKDGSPVTISRKYTPSLSEKAHLYKVIKGMTGQPPKAGFDVDSLLNHDCQILIETWTDDDGNERNGIGGILAADNGDEDDETPAAPAAPASEPDEDEDRTDTAPPPAAKRQGKPAGF